MIRRRESLGLRVGSFLFIGLDTGGTWKPMLGLAAQLVERGHLVTVLGTPSMRATIEAAGCSLIPLPDDLEEAPGAALEDDDFVGWMRAVTGGAVAEATLAAVEAIEPDVLVVDFLQFNALSAAELLHQPLATIVHFGLTSWDDDFWDEEIELLNPTRERLGLDPLPVPSGMALLWGRADVALSLLPAQWTPAPVPANLVTVGPIAAARRSDAILDLPWSVDDLRPLVLISMSSTYMHQEALLDRVAAAAAREPVRVLLSLAGAVSPTAVHPPSSVVVRPWLDLDAVLPATSLLVTHGGMATTTQALARGVPMLVLPQSRDQHRNAQRVVDGGSGLSLPTDSSEADIGRTVQMLLSDGRFRQAAAEFGASIRALGGGRVAIEELERLLDRSASDGAEAQETPPTLR